MRRSDPIQHLTDQFSKLPGIGERTALRLTLHLLQTERESIYALAQALTEVADRVRECTSCFMLTADHDLCFVCQSVSRDQGCLCVVANIQDLMAIEATADYRGLYHVLHGTLSPLEGIGPKELRMDAFMTRLAKEPGSVKEVIIATPPTVEGEATALFLVDQISKTASLPIAVTRIASGIPVGGDLQFADRLTLSRAMTLRRSF